MSVSIKKKQVISSAVHKQRQAVRRQLIRGYRSENRKDVGQEGNRVRWESMNFNPGCDILNVVRIAAFIWEAL